MLQKLFKLILQNEITIEKIRLSLKRRPSFDVISAFKTLEKDDKGFVTLFEFQEIMKEHGFESRSNELTNFIKRFDKDTNGKVTLNEFAEKTYN